MLAIDFELVTDINSQRLPLQAFNPTNLTQVGTSLFFTTGSFQKSLWKIDPATHEPVLVKTLPAFNTRTPEFVDVNGTLFFTDGSQATGIELWKSDGTEAGTVLVKDTIPGSTGGFPSSLTNVDGTLYFVVSEGSTTPSRPIQLWKSDGTTAGTTAITSIGSLGDYVAGSPITVGDSYTQLRRDFTKAGDSVYFIAKGAGGIELWRTDGTAAGTGQVADINPGSGGSNPVQLTAVGDELYFSANDGTHGHELWRTDGSVAGTVMVADINPGLKHGFYREIIPFAGEVFFRGNDGVTGAELWKSDGTAEGTELVKDLYPFGSSSGQPDMFFNHNGVLYFSARAAGFSLWKSDGTTAGTMLVKSRLAGGPIMDFPRDLDSGEPWATVLNGELYFLGGYMSELWKTDGTAEGTQMIRQVGDPYVPFSTPLSGQLTTDGGRIYFRQQLFNSTTKVWSSDGTDVGTALIPEPGARTDHSIQSSLNVNFGGFNYFVATDGIHGSELWRTDGTAAGTSLVIDINIGSGAGAIVQKVIASEDALYFVASNGTNRSLWRSDGTAAGSTVISPAGVNVAGTNIVDGILYFWEGRKLWKSDGTLAGMSLVKYFPESPANTYGSAVTAANDVLYFAMNDGVHGEELWRTDGTPEGTMLVKDLNAYPVGSRPEIRGSAGDFLYFTTQDGGDLPLWRTDGTELGTSPVTSASGEQLIVPRLEDGRARFLAVDGILYFVANGNDGFGDELWRTDGTDAGTMRLTDVAPGALSPDLRAFTDAHGRLLFTANVSGQHSQLWISDGTLAGTHQIVTLTPQNIAGTNSVASSITQVGDDFWIALLVPDQGAEIWRTDGTAAGTLLVDSVAAPGLNSSTAPAMRVVGQRVVLTLNTPEYGAELWSAQFIESPRFGGDFNRDAIVDGGDFLFWQRNLGAAANPYGAGADGDASGRVGSGDLDVWKEGYGKPIPPGEAVAAVATPPLTVAEDAHDVSLPVAAPLTATIAASVVSPGEANSWSLVAEKPAPRAERGRLSWFFDSSVGAGTAGRSAAFHVAARESTVFPADSYAALWKSDTAQAWDLLARESLVAGVSGLRGVSSSLRPEKSSPFDGEETDWRLEQLFQTDRLAGTDSRDKL